MENLINQICAMDEQIQRNKNFIEYVASVVGNNLVDVNTARDMANKVTEIGELTKQLLIEQYKLKNKLLNEYGIFYV